VQKHALLSALSAGAVDLTVTTTHYVSPTSQNVLATRPGRKAGPPGSRDRVMLCAHYDSVIGARGANDDGSGTVLCLELARTMRNLPTSADLSFALWGSEEAGLVGSRLYARGLGEEEHSRLRGVFNNDMVGTSWDPAEKYWVLDFLGQPNVVNAEVLAAGERLGYRAVMSDVTQRGASDHQSFSEVGIPSGNFSWRGVETPALLEPEYHSADDTIARNISVERLTISMELQGCAAYALARG
jgi:Zn-dependent M28 family amino/carboxypeptidase